MSIEDFVDTVVKREGLEDVQKVALARWSGRDMCLGVVFQVGGQWIHASDYDDLEEDDWQPVNVKEHVVLWARKT